MSSFSSDLLYVITKIRMDSGFTVENVIRWLGSVNTHHPRRTLRSMREASHDDTNKVRNRARACGANKPTS